MEISRRNNEFCWILNVIDSFTKFLWSYKLKSKAAIEIKKSLENSFVNF
ncbi:hypothetical protein H312_02571 [Anncaliia algerae PRA339]|uniref:Integrase catalytic domain-containing protein n=1 Tax=Anncaliia algerae PRA339 TaxID=1288291 RepID=A0A059EYV6_9MICR|nr:hypothetical protein H312_02571 [Anncaliia algerae PRA339]